MKDHKFSYEWKLSDGYPAPGIEYHGSKVFSCFACGGGSTMGYKLAGYDVLGYNEIDKRMAECYDVNHDPKLKYVEPIQDFKQRKDLPPELYDLDILDGSPPCSSFSMVGNREKDWGKDKKFREGQSNQVLDTLFFDFIDLAAELQPKIVVAENVKGLMQGSAKEYLYKIHDAFVNAGYKPCFNLLNASTMGVPQKRERVFFIAIRNDLADSLEYEDMFNEIPYIDLKINEPEIVFNEIKTTGIDRPLCKGLLKYFKLRDKAETCMGETKERIDGKRGYFSQMYQSDNKPCYSITSNSADGSCIEPGRYLNNEEIILAQTFPNDYNFISIDYKYLCGMSVPPIMMAQVAHRIYEQWICNLPQDTPC